MCKKGMGCEECKETPAPVECSTCDGSWSPWSDSSCVCGKGSRTREWTATADAKKNCANACRRIQDQRAACEQPKVEKCQWSAWGSWDVSACKGCSGTGIKEAKRVKNIKNIGECDVDCEGKDRKTEACDAPKVIDCVWGEWSAWESPRGKGKCSKECGSGTMERKRAYKIDANHCGKPCVGDPRDTKSCKDYDDVIDAKCEFTPFSECKATSGSCKDPKCKQTRTMKQTRNPNNCPSARSCDEQGLKSVETKDCDCKPCTEAPKCEPEDCKFEWNAWGSCTDECDAKNGKQYRSLTITKEPSCNGKSCPSTRQEDKKCDAPKIVDCVQAWSAWKESGNKCDCKKTRTKEIKTKPNKCGKACDKEVTQTEDCSTKPIDCSGAWGPWSQPPDCGKGSCKRQFAIKTPQNECGKKCADEGKAETE